PGETAIGVSASVLQELRAKGQTTLSATTSVAGMVGGSLTRIEPGTVPFTVIVNDDPVTLQAVHARWESRVGAREYWILDDPANPLMLRYTYKDVAGLTVVKMSYPSEQAASARIAGALSSSGRAVLYGISFQFG